MLKRLRLQLTLLYLVTALILGAAIGGGTYGLVSYYFRVSTDVALRAKMALQFALLHLPIPIDLYRAAEQSGVTLLGVQPSSNGEYDDFEHEISEYHEGLDLADIYVLPLDREGERVGGQDSAFASAPVDKEAVTSALENGSDLRTINASDGTPMRILTYKLQDGEQIQVLQIGRYLSAQIMVMQQLLRTMILLGGVMTLIIGTVAWILAGKTIKPAQQAWDKQQTFVANASHELRTPLTLIRAGVEVAMRSGQQEQRKQILGVVLADADYMNKLIEELLLLSRLDSHALNLDLKGIALAEFIPEIGRQVARVANEREIHLKQEIQPVSMKADPLRLKQILLIVLDNAIRNTPVKGIIFICVTADAKMVKISIKDTGAGIPLNHIEKVFDRFFKVNNPSVLDYKGSGLGLSIAKSLTEAMNGTISVNNSTLGGAEVTLSFPRFG